MKPNSLEIDETTAARCAHLVLDCIDREYPNSNLYWLDSDDDVKPPHELTPAFYGCLDWHSAVHGHWLLARLARYFPDAAFAITSQEALARSLTSEKLQGEIAHFQRLPFFECPYGMAWLLQLVAELREWENLLAKEWLSALEPLETLVANNLYRWLQGLELPDRTGTHNQTAFALGLALDWADLTENKSFVDLVKDKAQTFYLSDRNYPLQIEPLGYDFLSPCLAEADLMRRVIPPVVFADWLTDFLTQLPVENSVWLQPVTVMNPQNYKQSHFCGLNLSRAWMLEGIIAGLPDGDRRVPALRAAALLHRQSGLENVASEHYASNHWLGTFAVYLLTARGREQS